MEIEPLIPSLIQLATGAVAGNMVGALFNKLSLNVMGNSLIGAIGGIIGAHAFSYIINDSSLIEAFTSTALFGASLTAIIGLIKNTSSTKD